MAGVQNIQVESEEGDQRLDRFLKRRFPVMTQGMIEKSCRKGEIRVDGGRVKSSTRVEVGQSVRVPPLPDMPAPKIQRSSMSEQDAEMIRALVIYRDQDILVLNKPHGLAVQGGSKTTKHIDGLSEALMFNRDTKPHLVHRLDRDTSGVLIMGRHPQAASKLSKIFQSRFIEKVYWAAVAGAPNQKLGRITFGLRKAGGHGEHGEGEKMETIHPKDIEKTPGTKRALTDFLMMENAGGRMSWLAMAPRTGRTHQLRAHAAAMGNPMIGDGKYGGSKQENKGDGWGAGIGGEISKKLHLHARSLAFEHPFQKRPFFIAAPLPDHMQQTWNLLGWEHGREADIRWEEETEALKK